MIGFDQLGNLALLDKRPAIPAILKPIRDEIAGNPLIRCQLPPPAGDGRHFVRILRDAGGHAARPTRTEAAGRPTASRWTGWR